MKIKIQIPLAVTENGEWCAYSYDGLSYDRAMGEIMGSVPEGCPFKIYQIEVEVEVPEPTIIKGKVKEIA